MVGRRRRLDGVLTDDALRADEQFRAPWARARDSDQAPAPVQMTEALSRDPDRLFVC